MAEEKEKQGRAKKFFTEFKTFAVKGNMMDMAVGMIVGGAFTALVGSIVNNIAMPLMGVLIGIDFSAWTIELPDLYNTGTPNYLEFGVFLNSVISFIVVAFVVFLFVKGINSFRKKKEEKAPPPKPSKEEELLTEIRDILKSFGENDK